MGWPTAVPEAVNQRLTSIEQRNRGSLLDTDPGCKSLEPGGGRFELLRPWAQWELFPIAAEIFIMAPVRLTSVLIVDDDPIYRELMTSFLTKRSVARVLTAADGSEAKRQIEAHGNEIGLILCDLNMPDFDGVEYIMFLAEQRLTCALIIISGADIRVANAASKLATSLRLNLKGSLNKPVDFKQLDAILTEIAHPA